MSNQIQFPGNIQVAEARNVFDGTIRTPNGDRYLNWYLHLVEAIESLDQQLKNKLIPYEAYEKNFWSIANVLEGIGIDRFPLPNEVYSLVPENKAENKNSKN